MPLRVIWSLRLDGLPGPLAISVEARVDGSDGGPARDATARLDSLRNEAANWTDHGRRLARSRKRSDG
jgi:hypothetical protein